MVPGAQCNVVPYSKFRNITLRNVFIYNPQMSPGAFVGDGWNTIDDIVLDTVRVILNDSYNSNDIHQQTSNPFGNPQALYETFPGLYHLPPPNDPYVPKIIVQMQLEMTRLGNTMSHWHVRIDAAIRRLLNQVKTQLTNTLAHLDQRQQLHNGGGGGGGGGTNPQVYLACLLIRYTLMALENNGFWIWESIAACLALVTLYVFVHWIRYCKHQRLRQQDARRPTEEEAQAEEDEDTAAAQTTPLGPEERNTAITASSAAATTTTTESLLNQDPSSISLTRNPVPRTGMEPPMDAASIEEHDLATTSAKHGPWTASFYHVGFFIMALFTTTATMYAFSFPLSQPKWKHRHEYFVCQGVVRGVAKGQTWPIPDCFDHDDNRERQSTTSYASNKNNNDHVAWLVDADTTMFASLISFSMIVTVLCLALLCFSAAQRRRHRLTCTQRGRRTEDEALSLVAASLMTDDESETAETLQ
jgi:hypothetical protein